MGKNTAKINRLRDKISQIDNQIKEQTKHKSEFEKEAESLEFNDWKDEFEKLGIKPDEKFFAELGRYCALKKRGITIEDIEEMFSDTKEKITGVEENHD